MMAHNRPTVTSLKCPGCQAEITRFRTRNIPAYVIDAICPACGKAKRHITGFDAALTKMIREYAPTDPAPQGKTTPHPTISPGIPKAAPRKDEDPPAPMAPQLTLNATLAEPVEMARHIENIEGKALFEAPPMKPEDLPANVPTLPPGLTEKDLTALREAAKAQMANLTPEQKKQIMDMVAGK
jgi:hypothetical protein